MSEEAVVETAPEAEAMETAPAEQSNVEQPSIKDWLTTNAPEGASTKWTEKYADDASLAKGIYALSSLAGKKGDIPAEDATDEARAEFWGKLGANDINVTLPELGEEFGDAKGELSEYYGGIAETVSEIAKEVASTATSVPDLINKVVNTFVERDAKATFEQQLESKKSMDDQVKSVAAKFGMTVADFQNSNQEAINRMGWNNDTSIHEVIHQFNKMTSNSKGLQEAFLNNTQEGLQEQVDQLHVKLLDNSVSPAEHKLNVEKMKALNKRMLDVQNRG